MTTLNKLEAAIDLDKSPIMAVRRCYQELRSIEPFEITAFGPARPDEKNVSAKRVMTEGKRLQHASSNFNQGKWLTRLAALASSQSEGQIQILELGTCAGISAMYLLAGMAARNGGHLTTFEGSSELAALSSGHIDRFLQENNLDNVSYNIVVGSLDETLPAWIQSLKEPINLAFIDGNHQENATVAYHHLIRDKMAANGIVAHDDIAWGEGMKRAWQSIVDQEAAHEIVEFNLGGKASRGLIFLGQKRGSSLEVINTDGLLERTARSLKARLLNRK